MSSKRECLPDILEKGSSNIGLLLDRFSCIKEKGGQETSSQNFLTDVASQKNDFYKAAYDRWVSGIDSSNTAVSLQPLKVQGRMISGLGIATPLETGLSLHHTYGVPWLPGSGLKGLAAHYCHEVWGTEDPNFRRDGAAYEVMFGSLRQVGSLIFHDGWWVPDSRSPFKLDVIAVHHQDYYGGKVPAPTEFDNPIPVQFLSLSCSFKVAVQCIFETSSEMEQDRAKEWAVLGLNLLQEALMNWGFGGKTNAGYGRMVSDDFIKNLAAEKQKAELSEMPFTKVGDISIGIVKMDGGRKVEVAGKGELPCKSYPSAKVGMTAKIKAIEWPKKKPLPTMCEIIEVL